MHRLLLEQAQDHHLQRAGKEVPRPRLVHRPLLIADGPPRDRPRASAADLTLFQSIPRVK